MSVAELVTGTVLRYPYLWHGQFLAGETEGRKDSRPVAVGFRLPNAGGDLLLLFPITSKQPQPDRFAAEVPETEKRRAGLDQNLRLWIILDEFNEDRIGQSFYLRDEPPLGRLSRAFLLPLLKEFIARRNSASAINRHR